MIINMSKFDKFSNELGILVREMNEKAEPNP